MKLLSSLAQRIVNEVTHIINEEVIVVNDKGTIIAASDENRIGRFHEGARIAVKTKKQLIITEDDVSRLKGVKPGLNLPIIIDHHVTGVIGITGEPGQVVQFGQLIRRMTELIIQEAYSSERLESKYRGLETFVYEWVHKEHMDQDFMERGEILGISMFVSRMCILFELEHAEEEHSRERVFETDIIDHIREQFYEDKQDVVVRWGQGRFVLLKHMAGGSGEAGRLKHMLQSCSEKIYTQRETKMFIGAGNTNEVPTGLHRSYEEAKKALRAAKKQQEIMFYSDLSLEMALAEITDGTRQDMIRKVIGPIQSDKELMETVKVFLQCNLNMKETARKLHIHINTLHYRLNRVSDLTGRPVKNTDQLVSLYMALFFSEDI